MTGRASRATCHNGAMTSATIFCSPDNTAHLTTTSPALRCACCDEVIDTRRRFVVDDELAWYADHLLPSAPWDDPSVSSATQAAMLDLIHDEATRWRDMRK